MTIIEDKVEMATKELPRGYLLSLNVERWSAWVSLLDPDGKYIDIDDTCDELCDKIHIAVGIAIDREYSQQLHRSGRTRKRNLVDEINHLKEENRKLRKAAQSIHQRGENARRF